MPAQSAPLLRVSIEPVDPRDWEKLSRGLKLLNRADPVLEVRISPSGEHLVCAIGELHLERCLKDLRELFAKVEFKVSEPLASFRETLVHLRNHHVSSNSSSFWGVSTHSNSLIHGQKKDDTGAFVGPLGQVLPRGVQGISIRACPLPDTVVSEIEDGKFKVVDEEKGMLNLDNTGTALGNDQFKVLAINQNGNALMMDKGASVEILASETSLKDGLISGFQLAARSGPICEEPMRGVAFVIELMHETEGGPTTIQNELDGGAVVSSFSDAYRRAFKAHCEPAPHVVAHLGSRLVEAIFKCSLHCLAEGEQLGNLYSVVSRRRGKIVSEGMVDGTSLFQIEALIPVVEAYGIADELRKKTSGSVSSPQLVFSHWEVLDIDPYFKKTTEDELEAEGETVQADRDNNLAYKLMTNVRRRKGLNTGEKLVASADKQRTLSKKV